jgi:hypothetical protein
MKLEVGALLTHCTGKLFLLVLEKMCDEKVRCLRHWYNDHEVDVISIFESSLSSSSWTIIAT